MCRRVGIFAKRKGKEVLVCVKDFQKKSNKLLTKAATDFYSSGATSQTTLADNETSFRKWFIRPRILRDVSKRDLTTSILGMKVSLPFGVAPMGIQGMAHPEGDSAIAKAAASYGAIYTLSTMSSTSIEKVMEATPESLKFFQLYIYKDRNLTAQLVTRAEKIGYKALVLTVDLPSVGIRYDDMRNKFRLPLNIKFANFEGDPTLSDTFYKERIGVSALNAYVTSMFDPAVTWNDVAWLKKITSMPIIIKGILTGEDAELCLEHGASAIWVSNHGGRQLDGVYPTMIALKEVVEKVGDRCEVYIDGGFRTGPDIFKALAVGAKIVFLGRPMTWGIACDGEDGAALIFKILKKEFDSCMALSGCSKTCDIKRDMVIESSQLQ